MHQSHIIKHLFLLFPYIIFLSSLNSITKSLTCFTTTSTPHHPHSNLSPIPPTFTIKPHPNFHLLWTTQLTIRDLLQCPPLYYWEVSSPTLIISCSCPDVCKNHWLKNSPSPLWLNSTPNHNLPSNLKNISNDNNGPFSNLLMLMKIIIKSKPPIMITMYACRFWDKILHIKKISRTSIIKINWHKWWSPSPNLSTVPRILSEWPKPNGPISQT